jgi:predicted ribosomally synthesized peptide with nif11-like leader
MSNEKVLSFLNECKVDHELQEKLTKVAPEDKEGLIKIANEAGYGFTAEEWAEYEKTLRAKKDELTEDELDNVSGGGFFGLTQCPKGYNYWLCDLSHCSHFESFQIGLKKFSVNCNDGYFTDKEICT